MKKLLFIAVLSLMTSVVCKANVALVKNNTHCFMSVSLNGGGGYIYNTPPLTTISVNSAAGLNITAGKVFVFRGGWSSKC